MAKLKLIAAPVLNVDDTGYTVCIIFIQNNKAIKITLIDSYIEQTNEILALLHRHFYQPENLNQHLRVLD